MKNYLIHWTEGGGICQKQIFQKFDCFNILVLIFSQYFFANKKEQITRIKSRNLLFKNIFCFFYFKILSYAFFIFAAKYDINGGNKETNIIAKITVEKLSATNGIFPKK